MKYLLIALTTLITLKSDPNPGLLDDPGCKTLIKNQLVDLKENSKDYTIVYAGTWQNREHTLAMNIYTVTDKRSGKQMLASVGLEFEDMPTPTPSPSPSPTPSPARLDI